MNTHNLRVISIASKTVVRNGRTTTPRPTCVAIDEDVTLTWVADWDQVPPLLDVIKVTFHSVTLDTPPPPNQETK